MTAAPQNASPGADAAAAPLLTAKNLHFAYGARAILAVQNLALMRGQIAWLTGDNGAGKSTLLRVLAGLLRPTQCERLQFDNGATLAAPAVVYLHQTPYLFASSVRANVEYGLRCCRLPLSRANDALHWAGVSHLSERSAGELSGGEQRRVALARVRALRPRLYLLDEPLAHLDADGKRRATALIARLRQENATAIISSHSRDIPATCQWRLKNADIAVSEISNQ